MLLHTRCYCQHIRVENNVKRIEAYFINQDTISSFGNSYFALIGTCLSFFVKAHHNYGGSKTFYIARMLTKLFFTRLQ